VKDADWIRFVDDLRASVAAYEAALTKNQDAMVDASGTLSEACFACHRVYRREPTPGDRCIAAFRAGRQRLAECVEEGVT
jgi:hypothetical protein